MLQAMNTGHDGSLVTVHANSSEDTIHRLQTLASMSDVKLPYEAISAQISSAIDAVVQLSRGPDGSRRLVEVAVVDSSGRDLVLRRVMHFEAEPIGADRAVRGVFTPHPLPASVVEKLFYAGEGFPPVFAPRAGAPDGPRGGAAGGGPAMRRPVL
jgi:pilus assembly protein CpaF